MRFANPKVAAAYAAQSANPKPRPSTGGPRISAAANAANAVKQQGAAQRAAGSTGLGAAMSGPKTGLGTAMGMKKMAGAGAALGKNLGMKSGGSVGSASKRADGIATKGKTRGKMC